MLEDVRVNIIGSGLAGLSAARVLAQCGVGCRLISNYPSERAQSVLAEGGINAALNTMGEHDSFEEHAKATIKAGAYLADPNAVWELCKHAPEIVYDLAGLGVPFNAEDGRIIQRNFGGQKKKRTAFAKSSTGKVLMSALIDAVRRFEAQGLVERFSHHEFERLLLDETGEHCQGVVVRDIYRDEFLRFVGPTIMCTGGLNGLFSGLTTGSDANTSDAASELFSAGVAFGNLEMIQYHPTTFAIASKRCLVSEAARGEGARLFSVAGGGGEAGSASGSGGGSEKGAARGKGGGSGSWGGTADTARRYFMEETYPEQGNLAPRDVISREEYFVLHDPLSPGEIFLDMSMLSSEVWQNRLSDLREEIIDYLGVDPAKVPIRVEPAIHYFMGGIDVDERHRSNIGFLYAAGECCDQYHGANRLGGNSMLGAIYGGRVAAAGVMGELSVFEGVPGTCEIAEASGEVPTKASIEPSGAACESVSPAIAAEISAVLAESLGIVRDAQGLAAGLAAVEVLLKRDTINAKERKRLLLAKAMLISADHRKESRGAHYRCDYPAEDANYRAVQILRYMSGEITCTRRPVPDSRES